MQELLKKNQHFHWEERHQEAFHSVKQALSDATTLAAPNEQGRFVLDTAASTVAIAGILHQKQEYNGKTILRPIVYGSKSLKRTQLNYGAPKLEMYAVFYFCRKILLISSWSRIHPPCRQPGPLMAQNLLNGPSHDWPLDCAFGPVSLQNIPPTPHTTPKRRWAQ